MRYLSLEVVFSIAALAWLASQTLGVELPWTWYVVVPMATWALYTMDRLYDVRKEDSFPATSRHKFHRRHLRLLGLLSLIFLIAATLIALISFPASYWLAALGMGFLLSLHPLLQRSHSRSAAVLKDTNVAVTFTVGAWSIPLIIWLQTDNSIVVDAWYLHVLVRGAVVFVALLALVVVDVVLLSRLDAISDADGHQPSIAVALGNRAAQTLIVALIFVAVALSISLWISSDVSGLLMNGRLRPAAVLLCIAAAYSVLTVWRPRNADVARIVFEGTLLLGFLS